MSHEELLEYLQREKDRLFQYASYRLPETCDAEDALQDLYIALTTKIGQINHADPKPYMYRALSNICTTRLRNKKYHLPIDGIDVTAETEKFDEEFRLINSLLLKLPEEQSETIRLHLHCELTFAEVAEIMEVPAATVKSRYRYGIDHIRKELKKMNYFNK